MTCDILKDFMFKDIFGELIEKEGLEINDVFLEKDIDYIIDEEARLITITESGANKINPIKKGDTVTIRS